MDYKTLDDVTDPIERTILEAITPTSTPGDVVAAARRFVPEGRMAFFPGSYDDFSAVCMENGWEVHFIARYWFLVKPPTVEVECMEYIEGDLRVWPSLSTWHRENERFIRD